MLGAKDPTKLTFPAGFRSYVLSMVDLYIYAYIYIIIYIYIAHWRHSICDDQQTTTSPWDTVKNTRELFSLRFDAVNRKPSG
jgi:hypothetical protein